MLCLSLLGNQLGAHHRMILVHEACNVRSPCFRSHVIHTWKGDGCCIYVHERRQSMVAIYTGSQCDSMIVSRRAPIAVVCPLRPLFRCCHLEVDDAYLYVADKLPYNFESFRVEGSFEPECTVSVIFGQKVVPVAPNLKYG